MTRLSPEGSRRREALDEVTLSAFQITAALIVILDREGRIVRFNPACEQFTGWTEADVQGQLLWPLVLDERETARAREVFAHLTPRTDVVTYENTWLNHAGERRDLHWRVTFLPGADGEIDLIVSTGIDVTGERRAQRALQDSETLFRTLFRYSADGVVLIDPHDPVIPRRIVRCNPAFARMNGYEPQDLIGQSIDLLREDDLTAQRGVAFLSWIRDHPDGAHSQATHRHRDGHLLYVDRSSTVVTVDGQELILALDRDVTAARQQEAQLQRANEHLAYLAQHDELTGLLSRNAWLARLGEMSRAPGCHVALFLDLDAFKQVNDTYGHAVGDGVLQAVAARLLAEVRPSDAVGRLGGDEFLVALTLLDDTQIAGVVARLERVISAPYRLSGLEVRVGVSIGSAVATEDLDGDGALRRADHEMYRVKRTRSA